ncbi:flagellar basal body rod protein FlgB [Bdellovibrio reynosensis]|uniref:Flagellar basal body rod protein FlgB n=1 Tax=Bdellovibrio reynosensis TaxID=2835041 RepID=A0ABY4CAC7_9BACT|nr:flagellar basal body rod protein FlgB [Bdellovibrio reynosensis]UOF00857.1 flagellar basal body rod protein FlgB [Bdellovibrio reynosensis]
MSNLFDKTTNALASSIAMRQIRNNVISSNIANAETPGYHAKKMDFEGALQRALDLDGQSALSTSDSKHFGIGGVSVTKTRPDIYDDPEGAVNNDGNTVDLEKEMSALSENAIMYKTALQLINKKMAALKYAATDGGR